MDDETNTSNLDDEELHSTVLIAIVIGCTGFLLMVLGGVYYLSRLGDVPSRKAVGAATDQESRSSGGAHSSPQNTLAGSTPTKSPRKPPQEQSPVDAGDQKVVSSSNVNAAFNANAANGAANEELIEIYAPAGKLGVILDTPGAGPPIVHEIRVSSVLKDELRVGDRLIAFDDEDVRTMTANKVSKMISRKMDNATRKFSIIRTVVVPDV